MMLVFPFFSILLTKSVWIIVSLLLAVVTAGANADDEQRNLRGGGGGYSGGSYYGGGGYRGSGYYGGGSNGSSSSTADNIFGFVVIGLVGAFVILICLCLCCGGRHGEHGTSELFQEEIIKAKLEVVENVEEVCYSSSSHSNNNTNQPWSGDYAAQYIEDGLTRNVTLTIEFVDNSDNKDTTTANNNNTDDTDSVDPSVKNDESKNSKKITPCNHPPTYKIRGNGRDDDGCTVIKEGYATIDGRAWWREETTVGHDAALQVLSKGKFNFVDHTFTGTWYANSGLNGTYMNFIKKDSSF